jgi:hypothetical protein
VGGIFSGRPAAGQEWMTDGKDQTATRALAKDHLDREAKLCELYRDYIKHEDSLRGQRTGWLLTIQGFLFAALVVRCRRKIPSGQEPSAEAVRLPEPERGYHLSASHY